ncbi:MAG: glycosyltransferase family 4 protein, partial [Arenimonas sp.]
MQSRLAAMLVTRNFPPLQGGMERLNQQLLISMSAKWRMVLCGPSGASKHVPDNVKVHESSVKPLWWFMLRTLCLSVFKARKTNPALIIAGSGLTAPLVYLAAKLSGSRSVVYLHGLDLVVANKIYQLFWLPMIRRCNHVLVNSKNTAALAIERGVQENRIHLLSPGTDIPMLDASLIDDFRANNGLGKARILLAVGRLTARKGLAEFVANCLPELVSAYPDLMLVIIGGEATDALNAGKRSEKNRIQQAADNAGVGHNIVFLGRCDDLALAAAYQAAEMHVFPVQDLPGDVEGFGMVAIEAAAHGLSTIAFATGGVSEAVANGLSGELIAPGDYRQFSKAVLARLKAGRSDSELTSCRTFAEANSWDNFARKLDT